MDPITEKIINRIIAKFDAHIEELETIYKEHKAYVNKANENPESLEVKAWAKIARENLRLLKMVKAQRDSLREIYLKK